MSFVGEWSIEGDWGKCDFDPARRFGIVTIKEDGTASGISDKKDEFEWK